MVPMTSEMVLEKRNKWIEETFQWIEVALEKSPPEKGNTDIRRVALELLDNIFHIESAPALPPVQQFFQRRMEKAVREIGETSVVSGAVIWKLYNHSFVVKTTRGTLGFDISKGTSDVPIIGIGDIVMSDEQIERLANMLDILFISHNHVDHFTWGVGECVHRNGKPIIAPEEVWSDKNISLIRITEGELEFPGMKVKVFPGHQDDLQNNVYLVEVDHLSIMHTGDQYNQSDFEKWIDSVWREHRVDILIPNCWLGMNWPTHSLRRCIQGVNPKIIIPGHEHELTEHYTASRPSYMETYRHLESEHRPYFVMTWGEKFRYVVQNGSEVNNGKSNVYVK